MALTMTLINTDSSTSEIWLILTSSSILSLTIHIRTSKDTVCMFIAPHTDLFVQLSLSLPINPFLHRNAKMGFVQEFPFFQDDSIKIKIFPFSPAYVSGVWISWQQAVENWFWL